MPLMEAAGTSVERIRPESVKNSTPPERSWLSVSVSEPSWLLGKIWISRRLLPYGGGHLARPHVHGVRLGQVIGIFVGERRRLAAGHEWRADRAAENGACAQSEEAAAG